MHLVSYIDTQTAHFTPLSVARIFGGLLPRLRSFMLIRFEYFGRVFRVFGEKAPGILVEYLADP